MIIEDYAIILSCKSFAEKGQVITALLKNHGLCRGFFNSNKKMPDTLQRGNVFILRWKARLQTQLGSFEIVSSEKMVISAIMFSKLKLLILNSSIDLCYMLLQDRQAYKDLFLELEILLMCLLKESADAILLKQYYIFELYLLSSLGYGLTLNRCAVSGVKEGLYYLSPKSGMAVTKIVGDPYHDLLFKIPNFFLDSYSMPTKAGLIDAMAITKYFMQKYFQEYPKYHISVSRNALEDLTTKLII